MIKVTQTAAHKIKEDLKANSNNRKIYVRLYMGFDFGCCGPKFQLAPEEFTKINDKVIEIEGIKFVININQSMYFKNVKLDYKKTLFGSKKFQLTHTRVRKKKK